MGSQKQNHSAIWESLQHVGSVEFPLFLYRNQGFKPSNQFMNPNVGTWTLKQTNFKAAGTPGDSGFGLGCARIGPPSQRLPAQETGADEPKVDFNPGSLWRNQPPLGLSRLWGSQKTEPWPEGARGGRGRPGPEVDAKPPCETMPDRQLRSVLPMHSKPQEPIATATEKSDRNLAI